MYISTQIRKQYNQRVGFFPPVLHVTISKYIAVSKILAVVGSIVMAKKTTTWHQSRLFSTNLKCKSDPKFPIWVSRPCRLSKRIVAFVQGSLGGLVTLVSIFYQGWVPILKNLQASGQYFVFTLMVRLRSELPQVGGAYLHQILLLVISCGEGGGGRQVTFFFHCRGVTSFNVWRG